MNDIPDEIPLRQFVSIAKAKGYLVGCWPEPGDKIRIFASHESKQGIECVLSNGLGARRIMADLARRL